MSLTHSPSVHLHTRTPVHPTPYNLHRTLYTRHPTPWFITDVALTGGQAWLAARAHWTAPEDRGGLLVWDIASCTAVGEPIRTELDPFSLDAYD